MWFGYTPAAVVAAIKDGDDISSTVQERRARKGAAENASGPTYATGTVWPPPNQLRRQTRRPFWTGSTQSRSRPPPSTLRLGAHR